MIEYEKAYIAGFFDGEGTITCQVGKPTKYGNRIYNIVCAFYNTDRSVLNWIQQRVGGTIHVRPRQKPNHNEHLMLYCRRQTETMAMLAELEPYLIIKRKAVHLALEYLILREPTKHLQSAHNPITEDQLNLLKLLRQENMKRSVNAKPINDVFIKPVAHISCNKCGHKWDTFRQRSSRQCPQCGTTKIIITPIH